MNERDIQLPIDRKTLESLIAEVAVVFGVPASDRTDEAVAQAIMHLPHTQATAAMSYFGAVAIKSHANEVAYTLLQEIDQKRRAEAKALEEAKKLALVPTESDSACGEKSI